VCSFGVVELQSASERLEYGVGSPACSGVTLARRLVRNSAMSLVASTHINIPLSKRGRGALSVPLSQGLSVLA